MFQGKVSGRHEPQEQNVIGSKKETEAAIFTGLSLQKRLRHHPPLSTLRCLTIPGIVRVPGYYQSSGFQLVLGYSSNCMLIIDLSLYLSSPIDTNLWSPYPLVIPHIMKINIFKILLCLGIHNNGQQSVFVSYSLIVKFIYNSIANNYLLKL